MKRIILLLFVFCTTTAFSQEKKVLQEDECYQYAMVSFLGASAKKYAIYIQEGGAVDSPHKLTDENENELNFPTWIDALNYMSLQGWEIAWHNSNTNMMEQWILKKQLRKIN